MKKKQSNLRTSTVYERFYFIYKTTLHYCLNCRKIQKVKFQKLQRQIKKKKCFYQNLWYVIAKN